jgi:TfoX/Sxy family transcriptional regulator of competence genes
MSSSTDTVKYICDQAGLGRRLVFKKMFGEFALYLDGTIVALVCDDQLFLKPTEKGRDFFGEVKEAPPYPGAKSYFLLTVEIDDPDRLREAVLVTAKALLEPKPKVARAAKNTSRRRPSANRLKAPAKGTGKKRKS